MIYELEGNILYGNENIICHQVNMMGVMGAGLAKQIRIMYPEVYEDYRWYLRNNKVLLGDIHYTKIGNDKYIFHLFCQNDYGTDKRYTNYEAMSLCLAEVANISKERNYRVALPYGLGCGLGGGDWSIVRKIIDNAFRDLVIIYKLKE